MAADAKKFHDIWLMNEEEAKGLAEKLLKADKVIHEQQLNIQWEAPDTLVKRLYKCMKSKTQPWYIKPSIIVIIIVIKNFYGERWALSE